MSTDGVTTAGPRKAAANPDISYVQSSPTRVELTVRLGGEFIHSDTINLNNARTRKAFATEVIARSGAAPDRAAKLAAALEKRLIGIAAELKDREANERTRAPGGGAGEPPGIQCNNRGLGEITRDALDAIRRANEPPQVFQRGGALARVRVDPETGAAVVAELGETAVRGHLARVAVWYESRVVQGKTVYKLVPPPLDVVRDLLALPDWDAEAVPRLTGVAECPTFSVTGGLLNTPGYDAESAVWYAPAPGLAIPLVATDPRPWRITEAKRWLLNDLMGDFPFKDQASRANALALLLLPFVRSMVDGPTPLHLIDASTAGTGKGLLADAVHVVATGRCHAPMSEANDDDEWRKRVAATLRGDPKFLLIDNINGYVDSAALASCLTARTIKERILGSSKTMEVAVRCVWVGTGNNVRMSQELARRTPQIRLIAAADEPWNRPASDFRHPDLIGWATRRRGRLIWSALTLCRAWLAAGRPPGGVTVGSYESWSRTMSGILEVVGCPGFMTNAGEMMAGANNDAAIWGAFVARWWEDIGAAEVGVEKLFELACRSDLLAAVRGDGNVQSQKVKLGRALSRKRDCHFGGRRLAKADGEARNGTALYRLEPRPGEDATRGDRRPDHRPDLKGR